MWCTMGGQTEGKKITIISQYEKKKVLNTNLYI